MRDSNRSATSRGRPRDPDVDKAILKVALEMFAEYGVEGTSIEQVAKGAGVTRLTVYRRWSSKEELLAQAIETAREHIPGPESIETDDIPLPELINRMVSASVKPLLNPMLRTLTAQLIASRTRHPELMVVYWRTFGDPRRKRAIAVLERAKQEGWLADDVDCAILVDLMVGAVLHRLLMQPGEPDFDEMRTYLMNVIRHAGLDVDVQDN